MTHPRNAGRNDLGCPFGCRQIHRKNSAIKRSVEYYQSEAGKIKKRHLNARRNNHDRAQNFKPENESVTDCEGHVDEAILSHFQTAISLIEGRFVEMDEIIMMVTAILRQLSIDKTKKFSYGGSYNGKIPP